MKNTKNTHLLGFTNISDLEVAIFVKKGISDNESLECVMDDVYLIDKLLTIKRNHRFLIKKRGLKNQLQGVIHNHIYPDDALSLNVKSTKNNP